MDSHICAENGHQIPISHTAVPGKVCCAVLDNTSGLPGRRPVTPRACGARLLLARARRRSIHPLHRAPRDHHCCPTRAGPVPFIKIAPQASPRGPCRQCGGPRAVSQPHDFLEIGNFAPFSEYLHIKVDIFRNFFRSSLRMTPMNHEKFHGNLSAGFQKSGTQTDRQTRQLYIYRRTTAFSYDCSQSSEVGRV